MKCVIFMKKIMFVFSIAIVLVGCGTSYVDNKKEISSEFTVEQSDGDETTSEQENIRNSFSMMSSVDVGYFDEDGMWVNPFYKSLNFDENVERLVVRLRCEPDSSLEWKKIPVRLYVIDNGNPILFALEDGEQKMFHDIEYTVNKQQKVHISIEQSQLCAETGKLCVIAVYNPSGLPGKGIEIFAGTAAKSFDYVNSGYNGDKTVSIADAKGEYLEIPEEVKYTEIKEIGPDGIYTEEYKIKNIHYFEDVKVNNLSELYMYVNSGKKCSDKQLVGIICDGELLQFEDGSYFKWFDSESGTRTLQYNMQEFKNIEPGLHYFQVISMSLEPIDYENISLGVSSISNRYRVDIGGDN